MVGEETGAEALKSGETVNWHCEIEDEKLGERKMKE